MRGWITTKGWLWTVFGLVEFGIGFAVGRLT